MAKTHVHQSPQDLQPGAAGGGCAGLRRWAGCNMYAICMYVLLRMYRASRARLRFGRLWQQVALKSSQVCFFLLLLSSSEMKSTYGHVAVRMEISSGFFS
jgi:hypothetical protein